MRRNAGRLTWKAPSRCVPSSASSSSSSDLRCGDHAARAYVHKVERMQRVFAWLAARD